MRAQAIEKMLALLTDEVGKSLEEGVDLDRYINLHTKAKILLDRNDPRDASVIRELMNGELDEH